MGQPPVIDLINVNFRATTSSSRELGRCETIGYPVGTRN